MNDSQMNRRDFQRLTAAAFGGVIAGGSMLRSALADDAPKSLLEEPHVCRGLNTCKGKGAGAKNDCAGQGDCASVAKHDCKGQNDCKGQGGCGAKPGENACKGQGGCGVPMTGKMWSTARKNYEAAMKKAGKKFGKAPAGK